VALSAVAARLEPKEAGEVAATFIRAMTKPADPPALHLLAKGLPVVVARMELQEAARVSAEAAATLIKAMIKSDGPYFLGFLAEDLLAVAVYMDPKEAARVCGVAAAILSEAMTKTSISPIGPQMPSPAELRPLAEGLSVVAARMDPKEASRVCAEAAVTLSRVMTNTNNPSDLWPLAEGLSAVTARMDPKEAGKAAKAAAILIKAMSKETGPTSGSAEGLSALLNREPTERRVQRARNASCLVGLGSSPTVLALTATLPHPALQHPPEPLPAEMLVELLKHPLCVGEARRVVLDQLGSRYGRPFEDQWDFVRFAEEQKLGLDFTSPVQRP
jgi:hypothetical protein